MQFVKFFVRILEFSFVFCSCFFLLLSFLIESMSSNGLNNGDVGSKGSRKSTRDRKLTERFGNFESGNNLEELVSHVLICEGLLLVPTEKQSNDRVSC